MSNSDEENRGTNAGSGKSYTVGNKKPPLHSRFKQGKSGNPSGRPKGRTNFDTTLLKEFYKAGLCDDQRETDQSDHDKLFAASLVKDGISKGPQSKLQLAKRVERLRPDWLPTPRPPLGKKPKRRKIPRSFKWTEAQERLYRELCDYTGVEPEA